MKYHICFLVCLPVYVFSMDREVEFKNKCTRLITIRSDQKFDVNGLSINGLRYSVVRNIKPLSCAKCYLPDDYIHEIIVSQTKYPLELERGTKIISITEKNNTIRIRQKSKK